MENEEKPNLARRSLTSVGEEGLIEDRLKLSRKRLEYMIEYQKEYLLSGFQSRPGDHPWQGEHVGKWLHAATLDYERTHDEKLLRALRETVEVLLEAQEENGYLGTYASEYTFMNKPENISTSEIADDVEHERLLSGGWDVWTHRYNIYGLLTYEKYHEDNRIVKACKKMGDLLIEVYGEGKNDLTKYGTRQGISSTTLLESVMMLYERTCEKKYLDFAQHIVYMSENNPELRLMSNRLEEKSVVYSGEGKAYQLIANLLGYLRLYLYTAEERYLKTVLNGWKDIKTDHLYITGGPWTRKMPYNPNQECFAFHEDFDPVDAEVETCATTTWIQLNLHLLELTNEARYAKKIERSVLNALLAAQYGQEEPEWCYYTRVNEEQRPYSKEVTCCASSGPRALEMFSQALIGQVENGISLITLVPCSVDLPESFGKARIRVKSDYPSLSGAKICFEKSGNREFALDFRIPAGSQLKSVCYNGRDISVSRNKRGFFRISQVWKQGDELDIDYKYLLKSHIEKPKNAQKWVAFTYGPWVLAQEIDENSVLKEPFVGMQSEETLKSLESVSSDEGSIPKFRVKDTEIILKPFYAAGSKTTGPRTYFKI